MRLTFWAFVWKSYRTRSSVGYAYEFLTEPTMDAVRTKLYTSTGYGVRCGTRTRTRTRVLYKGIPVTRVFLHRCIDRTEVPGTGSDVASFARNACLVLAAAGGGYAEVLVFLVLHV